MSQNYVIGPQIQSRLQIFAARRDGDWRLETEGQESGNWRRGGQRLEGRRLEITGEETGDFRKETMVDW